MKLRSAEQCFAGGRGRGSSFIGFAGSLRGAAAGGEWGRGWGWVLWDCWGAGHFEWGGLSLS